MFDFRLKVFHTVAKRLNFTKAADELFITQPAVTKHIQEIEAFYKCKLFERNGTKIQLTHAGNTLLKYTDDIFNIYRDIEFDLAALNENVKGTIKLGASTTVAQYVLPGYLALFKEKFQDIHIELTEGNTEYIENLLTENKIDLGIVEGQSKRQHIKYTQLIKDEIVLCTNVANTAIKKSALTLSELQKLPLVVREQGSGSLEVVVAALKKENIKFSNLNVEITLESSESIKSYLIHSKSFAFLSVHSVFKELKNNELRIVDIKELNIERYFYLITQQGGTNHLKELFLKFMQNNNLKL
ncbi:MAG: LysR family transcriptional regulator [Sphingobacteriia bacterium]|nr:LysR family transcriptional regulator [Sphingobacteriia bacterium]